MKGFIETGSIFRVKLPILGYGYCRIIHFPDISHSDIYLVKVYDFDYRVKLTPENLDSLRYADYMLNPLLLNELPAYNRKGAEWTLLGNITMPDDKFIPDFKLTYESILQPETEISEWFIMNEFGAKTPRKTVYANVRHLEHFHFYNPHGIAVRIAMEILKRESKIIQRYFDLRIEEHLQNYYRTLNMPSYADIPEDIRGKALNPSKGKQKI